MPAAAARRAMSRVTLRRAIDVSMMMMIITIDAAFAFTA